MIPMAVWGVFLVGWHTSQSPYPHWQGGRTWAAFKSFHVGGFHSDSPWMLMVPWSGGRSVQLGPLGTWAKCVPRYVSTQIGCIYTPPPCPHIISMTVSHPNTSYYCCYTTFLQITFSFVLFCKLLIWFRAWAISIGHVSNFESPIRTHI